MRDDGGDHASSNRNQHVVAVDVLPAMTSRWRFQTTFMPVGNLITFTTILLRKRTATVEICMVRLLMVWLLVLRFTMLSLARLCVMLLGLAMLLLAALWWPFHRLLAMALLRTLRKCAQAGGGKQQRRKDNNA